MEDDEIPKDVLNKRDLKELENPEDFENPFKES